MLKKVLFIILCFAFCLNAYAFDFPAGDDENAPVISITADKDNYETGEMMNISAEVSGDGVVDVYFAVVYPSGEFLCVNDNLSFGDSGIALPLIQNWSIEPDVYTLPIPVLPIFPEGNYEVYAIFVNAGESPLSPVNWISFDTVAFTITQTVDSIVSIEGNTITATLGEVGTLEIAIEDGAVTGTLSVEGPAGGTLEKTATGTYVIQDETLYLAIETESGITLQLVLTYVDGVLSGTYSTSTGQEGEINFDISEGINEPTDAPTDEPYDTPTDEPTDDQVDTPTDEPNNDPTDEPTPGENITWDLENKTATIDIGETGALVLAFSEGQVTGTFTYTTATGREIEKTATGTYSVDNETLYLTVETETGITVDFEMTYEDGYLNGSYTTSTGKEGSTSFYIG